MRFDDRVFLIDKAKGTTSFAAVRRLRRLGRVHKAGHCGSLDPNATGLLILCTGVATRVSSLFVDLPKTYVGRVRFGTATDSYDADGAVVARAPVPELEVGAVREALRDFEGEIEQIPPMVSALKHEGRRLYELAREGLEVERPARRVVVYAIALEALGAQHADIQVCCGRGCYVRSIAHDLGNRIGVPAHLESLRRIRIGPFALADATTLDELETALEARPPAAGGHGVMALPTALEFLPALTVRRSFETAVGNGAQPEARFFVDVPRVAGPHRLLSEDGRRLLAVAVSKGQLQFARVRFLRVFPRPLAIGDDESESRRSTGT